MVNMLIYRSPAVLPAGDLQINMLIITTPLAWFSIRIPEYTANRCWIGFFYPNGMLAIKLLMKLHCIKCSTM